MISKPIMLGQEMTHDTAFDVVFGTHHDYVYRLARALLGNSQDAEDVTQEVFLRVHRALPSYKAERASMRTWLTQIVVNTCQTQRRRNFLRRLWHANPQEDDDSSSFDGADPAAWGAPEGAALQSELRNTVRAVLAELRPNDRTVLVLHYYLDYSCPEIARIMGCPEGTIYSRLHHARRRVQVKLEKGANLAPRKVHP